MGSHGIYKRVLVGEIIVDDWQSGLPSQSTVKQSGYFGSCYVCGSKAAAKQAAAEKEAAQAKARAVERELQARAAALATRSGERLNENAAVAGGNLSASGITNTDSYRHILSEQQDRADRESNALLQDVTTAAVSAVAAQTASGGVGAGRVDSETCRQTLQQIAEYRRTITHNAALHDPTADEVNRQSAVALAGNEQFYDQNCR